MSYSKQTWQSGETITASKLNHMENGIEEAGQGGGNSPLIVNSTFNETEELYYLDKTFGEIRTAINAGRTAIIVMTTTSENDVSHNTDVIKEYSYLISNHPDYPSASGTVSGGVSAAYSVQCTSAPYTLAALDALYPFSN